jgi:hypothetical protein
MHDRLSEILDEEVVGEVTSVGNAFFDVAMGRVCLEMLDPDHVEKLLRRLRKAFPDRVRVADLLHIDDPSQVVRGMVLVTIRQFAGPYLLQITGRPLVGYYERRFMLEPGVMGDLWGTLCNGLGVLVAGGEAPLGVLSGYDELLEEHRRHLDVVVRAAVDGYDADVEPRVESLVEPMRRAWRLIPWPLRQGILPVSRIPQDRIAPHDPVLRRTILLAVDLLEGQLTYQYVHQHNPLEEYEQVLTWMTEVYAAMRETYPAPRHAAAMARASSVERFIESFPGFRKIVGTVLENTEDEEAA